jgi:hypothetical protein
MTVRRSRDTSLRLPVELKRPRELYQRGNSRGAIDETIFRDGIIDKLETLSGNLVRRPGEANGSGRERFPLCKPPCEPRLYFMLNPSHRVSGDSNTHGEATLRLELVNFGLAESGHIDDLCQTQNPNRCAP